jgi:hypothetical protein
MGQGQSTRGLLARAGDGPPLNGMPGKLGAVSVAMAEFHPWKTVRREAGTSPPSRRIRAGTASIPQQSRLLAYFGQSVKPK